MGDEAVAWLQSLPFAHRISPSPNRKDDLLIVHANPQDVDSPIFPTAQEQERRVDVVREDQSDEEIRPLLENTNVGIIAFGHVHFPNVRQVDGIILANISATSLPQDGDTRARYGLLTWNNKLGWQVERHHVSYNIRAEQAELAKSQPPGWERLGRWLDGDF
jgi:predicted phosphodiesterase